MSEIDITNIASRLGVTITDKPREFWIYDIADCEHPLLVKGKLPTEPCDFPNVYKNTMKLFNIEFNMWRSYREEIHVIEYSAYESKCDEAEKLSSALYVEAINQDALKNSNRKLAEANSRTVEFERIKEAHLKYQELLREQIGMCKEALEFYAKAPCNPNILQIAPRFREVAQETLTKLNKTEIK
jgi:hypothetical protein